MSRLFATFLVLVCLTIGHATEPKVDIELVYRRTRWGKPPSRAFECDLTIKNGRSVPIWIVRPGYAEDRLPADGRIAVSYWKPELFGADGYEIPGGYSPRDPENVGHFVQIHSLVGPNSNSRFHAFCLPAGAEFEFKNYRISAWKNVDSIELWVAKDIVVNGQVSFFDWFPFEVLASGRVQMKPGTQSNENMNSDRKTYATRTDLRQGPVLQLQIEALERHVLPIKPTDDPER